MNFFNTHISGNASSYINKVLSSTFLSEGDLVLNFEEKLEKTFNIRNIVTLNSGTSALHLSLVLANIKSGDEVILPAQTFIATGLAVLMKGGIPIFADIQKDTGNICPKSILEKISNKTKAIIPVHWAGYPCDMNEITKIAKIYNLKVIEDAAHALGAKYYKQPIGSISDYTCFSFQAIKHLTTGDGGAISIKNDVSYLEAKKLRWFGIDRYNSKISILGERDYDVSQLGFKYHLNNYAAALGLANIEDIDFILNKRKTIAKQYIDNFNNVSGIKLLNYDVNCESSWWLFNFLVEKREDFIRKLKENDIPSSVVHLGINKNSIFGKYESLPNQEYFDNNQISIPVHSDLTNEDVDKIIYIIKKGW